METIEEMITEIDKKIDETVKKIEFWYPEKSLFHNGILRGLLFSQQVLLKKQGEI